MCCKRHCYVCASQPPRSRALRKGTQTEGGSNASLHARRRRPASLLTASRLPCTSRAPAAMNFLFPPPSWLTSPLPRGSRSRDRRVCFPAMLQIERGTSQSASREGIGEGRGGAVQISREERRWGWECEEKAGSASSAHFGGLTPFQIGPNIRSVGTRW